MANERPIVGIIGLAGQGVRDARALEKARANVAALCDVDCEMPDQRATESTSAARTLRTVELIQSGALGEITEVHVTTDRPIWPQGYDRPPGEDVPPRTLDWDMGLGPAPRRPFLARYPEGHPVYDPAPEKRHQSDFKDAGLSPVPPLGVVYHPFVWRGWIEFGSGALGDIAPHSLNVLFWALDLGAPSAVEVIETSGMKPVAPLDVALVARLRKAGWEAVTIMGYAVPWEDFGQFDLIILSREGREYVTFFRERDTSPAVNRRDVTWLTPAQEQKFEDYVKAGGRLFLYHDGFGNYQKGNGVSRVARAWFIRHPAIVNIEVKPTGKMPELTEGVTPFTVADEEYEVEMDETKTAVFMESHSPEHGRAAQGWAHSYGKGKVAVFIPGHSPATIAHPMVRRSVQNITEWLTK